MTVAHGTRYFLREREFFSGIICGARIAGLRRFPVVHNLLVHRVFRRLYVEMKAEAAAYGIELMFCIYLDRFHGNSEAVAESVRSLLRYELEIRSGSPEFFWIRIDKQTAQTFLSDEAHDRAPADLFLEYGRRFKAYVESVNQPIKRVYLGDVIARILQEAGVGIASHNATEVGRRLCAILPNIQDEAVIHCLELSFKPEEPMGAMPATLPKTLATGLTMMAIASSVSLPDFLTVQDYVPLEPTEVPGSVGMYQRLAVAYRECIRVGN